MNELADQLMLNAGATEEAIDGMLKSLGVPLPEDYLDFLRHSNGCIGVGPDLFVILDRAEKVHAYTIGYGVTKSYNGLVIIGGDGCGNIIGIDARTRDPKKMAFVVVDAVWLDLESQSCQYRATTLNGILKNVATYSAD